MKTHACNGVVAEVSSKHTMCCRLFKGTRLCGRLLQSFEKAIQLLILLLPHNRYVRKDRQPLKFKLVLGAVTERFKFSNSLYNTQ